MAEPEGDEPMPEEPSMGDMWVEVKRKSFKTILCTLSEIVSDPIRKCPSARLVLFLLRPCSSRPYCIIFFIYKI